MELIDLVRVVHILGACILIGIGIGIGTGTGIAFFMLMAHRTADPPFIARTASVVVVADMLFTATAAIAQPITGYILARYLNWSFTEGWLILSLALYVLIGLLWLPVVHIQAMMREEAEHSVQQGIALTPRYHRLFRTWFACGFPAFAAVIVLLWLMVTRPLMNFWRVGPDIIDLL